MPSRAVRDHSPQPRRSFRQRKVTNAFAIPEADEELIEQRARHEPPAEEPAVDEEKCAEYVTEQAPLHEFLFVGFLVMMLFTAFTCPAIFAPLDDFAQRTPDPPPEPLPLQLPPWLAWLAAPVL